MAENTVLLYDAVVVGGGPVGLALAIGLLQRNLVRSLALVERGVETEWSKSYVYGIDARGISTLRQLEGVVPRLDQTFRENHNADRRVHIWKADGSLQTIPAGTTKKKNGVDDDDTHIKRYYSLQRNQLIDILQKKFQSCCKKNKSSKLIHGTVQSVDFANDDDDDGLATTTLTYPDGTYNYIRSKFVFGCDGTHSVVRQSLARFDRRFRRLKRAPSPSAGLVFRSLLVDHPHDLGVVEMYDTVFVKGQSGHSMTMLSFYGAAGGGQQQKRRRPMGTARRRNFFLYQCTTALQLQEALMAEFPQLEGRISQGSLEDYLRQDGIVFSCPSWATKAAVVTKMGACGALLGDALHHFPPDIGQGLNAGLLDVGRLLDILSLEQEQQQQQQQTANDVNHTWQQQPNLERAMARYNEESVREAAAICRLIRVLVPYQYNLQGRRDLIGKKLFDARLRIRTGAYHVANRIGKSLGLAAHQQVFYPPPVDQILRNDPPMLYSEIYRQQQWNTMALGTFVAAMVTLVFRIVGGRTEAGK